MTVYSNTQRVSLLNHSIPRHNTSLQETRPFVFNRVTFFNLGLAGLLVIIVFSYIFQMNTLTSVSYHVKILQDAVSSLDEIHGSLTAQQSVAQDMSLIYNYAQQNNMIEAGNVNYLFENENVALSK